MTTILDGQPVTQAAAVTVYTKPNCQQCRATFRWLDKREIAYTSVDITQNLGAYEYIKALGHLSAPVVVTSADQDWAGFRPDKLGELL